MHDSDAENMVLGAAAGLAASVIQAAIGKTEEILMLPPWEDSNIAPRLVDRVMKRFGVDPSPATEWILGTGYHLGYGAMWGMGYAQVRERQPVPPLAGGLLLGALIYGITFPRWGGAVQAGVERSPRRRTRRMTLVAASVAVGFGVATAYTYEHLRDNETARSLARRLAKGELPELQPEHGTEPDSGAAGSRA